jgi:hypothetical protein
MEEMSKPGWLIRLVKQAIWVDSLYFLYLLLLSTSKILASTQPTPYDPLHRHVGIISIFLENSDIVPTFTSLPILVSGLLMLYHNFYCTYFLLSHFDKAWSQAFI